MKIHIISVGKLDKKHNSLAEDYLKMISAAKVNEYEITYSKKIPADNIKKFEAELILKKISDISGGSALIVALDEHGDRLTSKEFSKFIEKAMMQSKQIIFIIGGAFGLDQAVLGRADILLRLSDMTLPHKIAKIMLLEQIYRAETIRAGHPYHK